MLNLVKKLYWAVVNFITRKLMIKAWKKGHAIVFPDIRWFGNDKPVTSEQLAPELDAQEALLFKSGNTSICFTHGEADGSMKMTSEYIQNLRGHWILVSCYNGKRGDIINQNLWLQREPNTISDTPIAMMVIDGSLYLSIERNIVQQCTMVEAARRWMEK